MTTMKTKQEQKDEAREAYYAVVTPAWEAFDAIITPEREAYQAIVNVADKALNARLKEINEQEELLEVEKEL